MFTPNYLIWAAASAALLAGCTINTASRNDDRGMYENQTAYTPGYGQPIASTPAPAYQQPVPAPSNFPTTGQWQWGTTPDGYRTRIWIPDNSWKPAAPLTALTTPPADQPPRHDELYRAPHGRYDTIRYPDGRLEHEWRADEPSTPLQGYWQIEQTASGIQRVWISSLEGVAGER